MKPYISINGDRVSVEDPDALVVFFCPQGGGWRYHLPNQEFHLQFKPELAPPPYRAAAVTAEFLQGPGEDEVWLPCYSNGDAWNGWGMPYLTRAGVDRLIKINSEAGGLDVKWADNGTDVLVRDEDGEVEGYYRLPPDTTPDGTLAWGVGAGSWCWDTPVIIPTVEESVENIKREIREDIAEGRVPGDIASFWDTDSHVDCNCYGGFCDDDGPLDALIAHFGWRDENEAFPDGLMAYLDQVHEAVDQWVKEGMQ